MYGLTVILINIITAVVNFYFDKFTDILGVIPRHGVRASVGAVKASVQRSSFSVFWTTGKRLWIFLFSPVKVTSLLFGTRGLSNLPREINSDSGGVLGDGRHRGAGGGGGLVHSGLMDREQ